LILYLYAGKEVVAAYVKKASLSTEFYVFA